MAATTAGIACAISIFILGNSVLIISSIVTSFLEIEETCADIITPTEAGPSQSFLLLGDFVSNSFCTPAEEYMQQ